MAGRWAASFIQLTRFSIVPVSRCVRMAVMRPHSALQECPKQSQRSSRDLPVVFQICNRCRDPPRALLLRRFFGVFVRSEQLKEV
jgi:hypothetical protein